MNHDVRISSTQVKLRKKFSFNVLYIWIQTSNVILSDLNAGEEEKEHQTILGGFRTAKLSYIENEFAWKNQNLCFICEFLFITSICYTLFFLQYLHVYQVSMLSSRQICDSVIMKIEINIAPTYLLLPLGKWGSKWGDFHWAMGSV